MTVSAKGGSAEPLNSEYLVIRATRYNIKIKICYWGTKGHLLFRGSSKLPSAKLLNNKKKSGEDEENSTAEILGF